MAISNLKIGLLRKYARWLGERIQLEKEIAAIEEAYHTLDLKKERSEKLKALQEATHVIMEEIDPSWTPEQTKPSLPNKQQLPWEHGAATRTAFSIMREIAAPISNLELTKLTIARLGGDPDDGDLVDRLRSNLDQSLRSAKDFVRNIGGHPSRWEIIGVEADGRPDPGSSGG
jgi:hypothetical protein